LRKSFRLNRITPVAVTSPIVPAFVVSKAEFFNERRNAMITFGRKRAFATTLVVLTLPLAAIHFVEALQAAEAKQQAGPKRHKLPATLETTQWGWLDPNEAPKLTVNSGDIVSIETMMHSHNKIQPGTTMDGDSYLDHHAEAVWS
jgi:hypothetical protein